jgi:hypothetical protein
LSDYDLVGSRRDYRGIFALDQVDHFDILYLPPPGKGVDLGPAAVLAAERYCRSRGAILVVDPPAGLAAPDAMVQEVRKQGYASPNMVSYFPRMALRRDGDAQPRAVGGAIAGLLCKLDRRYGAWQHLDQRGLGLSREFVPAAPVSEEDAQALAREGINAILAGEAGRARVTGSTTMARGSEMQRPLTNLAVRRLCLSIVNTIEQATRWTVFEPVDESLAKRIRSQVFAFLSALVDMARTRNFDSDFFPAARLQQADIADAAPVSKGFQGREHGIRTSHRRLCLTEGLSARSCGVPIGRLLRQCDAQGLLTLCSRPL